jgi:DivIVA domain-containing protein
MLSPDEIEVKEFLVALRGYRTDEVRAFLKTIADELRSVQDELESLRRSGPPALTVVPMRPERVSPPTPPTPPTRPTSNQAEDADAAGASSAARESRRRGDGGRPPLHRVEDSEPAVAFDPDHELARVTALGRDDMQQDSPHGLPRSTAAFDELRAATADLPSARSLWERLDQVISAVADLQASAVDVVAHANERRAAASVAETNRTTGPGEPR